MKNHYKFLKYQSVWFTSVLAVVTLLLSGCGKSQTSNGHNHEDRTTDSKTSSVSTAHSHNSPGETCFICDPSMRDQGRLWCREHGRYEDRCWLCHPELENKDRLFCKEHALFEDECFLCHPELAPGNKPTHSGDDHGSGETNGGDHDDHGEKQYKSHGEADLHCNEHDMPELECAICQPDRVASLKPGESMKLRFPSPEAAAKAGIRTARPNFTESAMGIKAYCEVQYNRNQMARVTPMATGIIHEVHHDVGKKIEKNTILAILHSADVASAKSEYLTALVNLDISRQTFEREKQLKDQRISAEREFLEAEAAYRTSQLTVNSLLYKLKNLGFSQEEISRIEQEQDASADLIVRTPFAGTLVERDAVVGEAIEAGHALFTVAKLENRWLALSVPADHLDHIHLGQTVEAHFTELPGLTYVGQVTWVDSSVDPRTRMVKARALIPDPEQRIKSGLFGEARILKGDKHPAAIVSRDSVQSHEGGTFVFIQDAPDLFSLRRVVTGETEGDTIHILDGLKPGESIVVENSFIVMSEFLKFRLGAGCVHE